MLKVWILILLLYPCIGHAGVAGVDFSMSSSPKLRRQMFEQSNLNLDAYINDVLVSYNNAPFNKNVDLVVGSIKASHKNKQWWILKNSIRVLKYYIENKGRYLENTDFGGVFLRDYDQIVSQIDFIYQFKNGDRAMNSDVGSSFYAGSEPFYGKY